MSAYSSRSGSAAPQSSEGGAAKSPRQDSKNNESEAHPEIKNVTAAERNSRTIENQSEEFGKGVGLIQTHETKVEVDQKESGRDPVVNQSVAAERVVCGKPAKTDFEIAKKETTESRRDTRRRDLVITVYTRYTRFPFGLWTLLAKPLSLSFTVNVLCAGIYIRHKGDLKEYLKDGLNFGTTLHRLTYTLLRI